MVCKLERVLRACDGFFSSISVTYDGAVLAQTGYFTSASYLDRKPMK